MNKDQFDILPNIVKQKTEKSSEHNNTGNVAYTFVHVGGDFYANESFDDKTYVQWFGKQFTFYFSNPIKQLRIHYKSINIERTIRLNGYKFTNLKESGFLEIPFESCVNEVNCISSTHNPYKLGHGPTDHRDLGILINRLQYVDIKGNEYTCTVNQIEPINSTLLKYFGHKNISANKIYYHCGDYGDIIYALLVIKHTGGGILYLGNDLRIEPDRCKPRDMIDSSKFKFLKTLLESQDYIKEVRFTETYPENITHDLNKFRKFFIKTPTEYNDIPNGANISLLDSPLLTFNVDLSVKDTKWLFVKNTQVINKKIVINRTERVRNVFGESDEAYKYVVEKFKDDSVFVGTDAEYNDFIARYGYVDRYIINSADELAQLIDQCYFFVGNSSFAFAISESLKKNIYFEIRDEHFRHTKFNRDGHHMLNMSTVKNIKIPNIYHVVPLYDVKDPETASRINKAKESWEEVYRTNDKIIPVHVYEKNYPRNTESFGDKRKCPFLKDMLRIAYERCESDDDIIMFTNDDTILSPFIGSRIHDKIVRYQACKSFRLNVKKYDTFFDINPHDSLGRDGGRDMFAMTKRWLKQNIALIPDYALGTTDWDYFLGLLIQFTNGISLSIEKNNSICETDIEFGHVLHVYHQPPWKSLKSINYYNQQLTKKGLEQLGFSDEFHMNYEHYKE